MLWILLFILSIRLSFIYWNKSTDNILVISILYACIISGRHFRFNSQITESATVNKNYATLSDDQKKKIAHGPELGDFINGNPRDAAENIKRKKGER